MHMKDSLKVMGPILESYSTMVTLFSGRNVHALMSESKSMMLVFSGRESLCIICRSSLKRTGVAGQTAY